MDERHQENHRDQTKGRRHGLKISTGQAPSILGSSKIADFYGSEEVDFQALLQDALANCEKDNESIFVGGLIDKFEQYGMNMYLSDKQNKWLRSIANRARSNASFDTSDIEF